MNLTLDFRTQSDYGTIRACAAIIAQNSEGDESGTGVAGTLRAFIQIAGFTVGHSVSQYDFFTPRQLHLSAAVSLFGLDGR
jgi:hypothetical protein